MRALVMMPNWPAPSELWMHRMIAALGPSAVAVATYAAPVASWGGRVPVVSLLPAPSLFAGRPALAALAGGWGAGGLRRALARWGVTAVLCHYLPCALRFRRVWGACGVPLFVHCHGYDVTWDLRASRWPHPRRFGPGYVPAVRALSERAVLVANSEDTRGRLEAVGVSPGRVVVKHLGVPVPDRPPARPPGPDGLRILYLGRLVDFKGPELTVLAFDLACRRGLRGSLHLAGDGPLRRDCERARAASRFADRIRLSGVASPAEGERLRAEADVFTAHNRPGPVTRQEEALGVSLLEAMAAGLPVVTGRSGGVPESVVDGETGVLFEPGDVEAHAEALLRLGHDPGLRLRLGRAGWRRARERFSDGRERRRLAEILGAAGPDRPDAPRDAPC